MQSNFRLSLLPARRHRRQFLSYIPMAPPPLFDLCVRRSFDQALERARTHPHEARFRHPRNWTALHCCVEHVAPLSLVKAIYQAHPESLTAKDWQGFTPEQAAVDPETIAFLRHELSERGTDTTGDSENEDPGKISAILTGNDPMLLGKALIHANNLSAQVFELQCKTEVLKTEIEELKATLKAISAK